MCWSSITTIAWSVRARTTRGCRWGRPTCRSAPGVDRVYDLSFFRNNLDAIALRLADRGFALDVEAFREMDAARRAAVTESEQLKAQKNAESQEIGKLRKAGLDATERQQRVREIGERIGALDQKATELDDSFRTMMAGVPEPAA